MAKFAQSADPKFHSTPTNLKIEMSERIENDYTFMRLDIYYQSLDDFEKRRAFELSHPDWQAIWFNDSNKHELVSLDVYHLKTTVN